jgi:hypothetical protein
LPLDFYEQGVSATTHWRLEQVSQTSLPELSREDGSANTNTNQVSGGVGIARQEES